MYDRRLGDFIVRQLCILNIKYINN